MSLSSTTCKERETNIRQEICDLQMSTLHLFFCVPLSLYLITQDPIFKRDWYEDSRLTMTVWLNQNIHISNLYFYYYTSLISSSIYAIWEFLEFWVMRQENDIIWKIHSAMFVSAFFLVGVIHGSCSAILIIYLTMEYSTIFLNIYKYTTRVNRQSDQTIAFTSMFFALSFFAVRVFWQTYIIYWYVYPFLSISWNHDLGAFWVIILFVILQIAMIGLTAKWAIDIVLVIKNRCKKLRIK